MRVLFFIHSLASGGAERVTVNLGNLWARKGWKVTIVTLASRDSDFYELHPEIKRISLELEKGSLNVVAALRNNLRRVASLRRVIRGERPEIVLSMMDRSNVLLALATIGLRNIGTIGAERIHPPALPQGRTWRILRSHVYGWLSGVAVQTEASAEWLRRNTSARTIRIIPNAAFWPLAVQSPVVEPPMRGGGSRLLLAVGRHERQKGFDLLIQAFGGLAGQFPQWKLVILGEGPERAHLETMICSLGLQERVSLPGRAGNVAQWYEAADLYVMSSRFEGFPNTLVEAMSYGVACVSFDCDTGPRDIIRHGEDGLLVPAEDVGALQDALGALMGDDELRSMFAERSVDVRSRFSPERILAMWEDMFEGVRDARD